MAKTEDSKEIPYFTSAERVGAPSKQHHFNTTEEIPLRTFQGF
jgi:hypothetical protein